MSDRPDGGKWYEKLQKELVLFQKTPSIEVWDNTADSGGNTKTDTITYQFLVNTAVPDSWPEPKEMAAAEPISESRPTPPPEPRPTPPIVTPSPSPKPTVTSTQIGEDQSRGSGEIVGLSVLGAAILGLIFWLTNFVDAIKTFGIRLKTCSALRSLNRLCQILPSVQSRKAGDLLLIYSVI